MTRAYVMRRAATIPVASVLQHVAFEVGRGVDELIAADNRPGPSKGRAATVWLSREIGHQPFPAIAAELRRSRPSVHAAKQRADLLRLMDADFRKLTDMLAALLSIDHDVEVSHAQSCPN